jgi:hypothetical protein
VESKKVPYNHLLMILRHVSHVDTFSSFNVINEQTKKIFLLYILSKVPCHTIGSNKQMFCLSHVLCIQHTISWGQLYISQGHFPDKMPISLSTVLSNEQCPGTFFSQTFANVVKMIPQAGF